MCVHPSLRLRDKRLGAVVLRQLKSEAMAEAEKLKAETDLYETSKTSEANLIKAQNEATATERMAVAEGVAAPHVDARKQFETKQKQMDVWTALSRNPVRHPRRRHVHDRRRPRSHIVGPLSPLSPSHGLFRGQTRLA